VQPTLKAPVLNGRSGRRADPPMKASSDRFEISYLSFVSLRFKFLE
jgi:hypothetical protein